MSAPVPKPDLQKLVDAVQETTELASELLSNAVPTALLQQIIAQAIERGVELQREALEIGVEQDDVDTPLIPPPMSEHPGGFEDEPTRRYRKLPRGV